MNIIDITPIIQKKNEKIRLAPYCRVSRDTEDQLNSFAAQIRYYSEYTKNHPEYEIVDIYADEGLTGMEMDKRDDFLRLVRDCKKGLIDRIIVKSVSRFARNTIEILETLRELKKCGVSVYFEEQGIDTEKLNMEMIITFPGMAAQQESEAISGNVRWSYQKRMQSGEFNCTCPAYGYNLVNGEMVINEDEAKVVRRIFELYLSGKGLQAIAGIFNEEQVPRRYGRTHWHHNTIRYILTNERYKGDALLQKKYTTDTLPYRLKLNKGEKTQYYVENSHAPIIDKITFEKAQELLKTRKNEEHARKSNVLSGNVRCPDCGGTFRRHEKNGKVYWFCMNTASSATRCKSRRVREKMLHEAFINMLYKLKEHRRPILETLINQMETLQMQTGQTQEKIQRIEKKLADLATKNVVVSKLHTSGILNSADYSVQTAEIDRQMAELHMEKKKILNEEQDERLDALRDLNEILEEYKPNGQFDGALFEQIVEKIIVNDVAHITFRLLGGLELMEEISEKGRCKAA